MKPPKCRTCGHRHSLGAACILQQRMKNAGPEKCPPYMNAAPADTNSSDSPAPSNADTAKTRGNVKSRTATSQRKPTAPLAGTSTSSGQTTNEGGKSSGHGPGVGKNEPAAPLTPGTFTDVELEAMVFPMTPAQKQKAYRARHKDRIREANRLRMAAKRKDKRDD